MKKRVLCLLCAAAMLALAACEPVADTNTPSPPPESATPVSTPIPTPTPEPTPTPLPPYTVPGPVTEEAINAYYQATGCTVRKLVPWQGDYLAEVIDSAGSIGLDSSDYKLCWIYGSTGREVELAGFGDNVVSYEVKGRAHIQIRTSGYDGNVAWRSFPGTYDRYDNGNENGYVGSYYAAGGYENITWLPLNESVFVGYREPVKEWRNLVCDARVEVNGLSFSFGIVGGLAGGYFLPTLETSLDTDTGRFVMRFRNTLLDQADAPKDLPAYEFFPKSIASFPAGSLGRDNYYLTDIQIAQDGQDVVVSAIPAYEDCYYTVERLPNDYMGLRISFSRENKSLYE